MLDRTLISYQTTGHKKYQVDIEAWMDGGGLTFGQELPKVIRHYYPDRYFDYCLDWCSGPGTIGFEILSQGIVNRLMLMDINGEVIRTAKKTIQKNNLQEIVKTLTSGSCAFLPKNDIYDLVISNPPHFKNLKDIALINGKYVSVRPDDRRKAEDKDWSTHIDFFKNIKSHLSKDGVIILQENSDASCLQDFEKTISENGLKVIDSFQFDISIIYYIILTHK